MKVLLIRMSSKFKAIQMYDSKSVNVLYLSSGVANPKEKEGRPEWALLSKRISSQS